MLNHYLCRRIAVRTGGRKLHVFCDNCFSQNKNHVIFVYFDNLCALGKFEEIIVTYPVPGHSYMPIDQAFGLIEKKRLKMEKVTRPEDWLHVIRTARPSNPFKICALNFPLASDLVPQPGIDIVTAKDYKTACGARLKKTPIAKIRSILFSQTQRPSFQSTIDGPWMPMDLLKRGQNRYSPLNCDDIGGDLLPVKAAKKEDINELLRYVDEDVRNSEFYRSIQSAADAPDAFDEYET